MYDSTGMHRAVLLLSTRVHKRVHNHEAGARACQSLSDYHANERGELTLRATHSARPPLAEKPIDGQRDVSQNCGDSENAPIIQACRIYHDPGISPPRRVPLSANVSVSSFGEMYTN